MATWGRGRLARHAAAARATWATSFPAAPQMIRSGHQGLHTRRCGRLLAGRWVLWGSNYVGGQLEVVGILGARSPRARHRQVVNLRWSEAGHFWTVYSAAVHVMGRAICRQHAVVSTLSLSSARCRVWGRAQTFQILEMHGGASPTLKIGRSARSACNCMCIHALHGEPPATQYRYGRTEHCWLQAGTGWAARLPSHTAAHV